MRWTLVLV